MTRLLAEQLFYGRIDRARSRTGNGGLQTLWHGRALSTAIVREIEAIVRCFDAASRQRLQFVRLSDGRFLISQTRPSRGEAVDCGGRGSFICRALVVDARVFRQFANHPLQLAEANPFSADVADLIEIYGIPPTEIEPLKLDRPRQAAEKVRPMNDAAADTLIRGAISARDLRDASRLIFLRAAPEDTLRALGWLFDHTPVRLRESCSFTTQIDRCKPAPRLFCFTSGTSTPAQRPYLELRLDRLDATRQDASRMLPIDEAGEMFVKFLASRRFCLLPEVVECVDAVCLLLAGSRPPSLPRLNDGAVADLIRQQPEAVAARFEDGLRSRLGRKSAVALAKWLISDRNPSAASTAIHLLLNVDRIGENPCQLLDLLESWLAAGETHISWWRRRKFSRIAARYKRRTLVHWLNRGSLSRRRRENLDSMTEEEFERSCRLLGTIPPAEFVCRRHISKLLRDRRVVEVDDQLFIDFLKRAESVDADLNQPSLKARIGRLLPESRSQLARLAGMKPRLQQLAKEGRSQQDKMEIKT